MSNELFWEEVKLKGLIIGGGPAGLTAAVELLNNEKKPTIWESENQLGGISRTVERNGWRFDLGGHRFFTKVERVEDFWNKILTSEDFLIRPRLSRIFYNGRFFDYPLRPTNALRNLGLIEAYLCVSSYLITKIKQPIDQSNFENWVAARFGWRLYRKFFKTYTEKVWGVDAKKIRADWAAQRIKNLSLGKAIFNSFVPNRFKKNNVTTLIEQFKYPKYGPGMMWEKCGELIRSRGGEIHLNCRVSRIRGINGSNSRYLVQNSNEQWQEFDYIINTMPINELILTLEMEIPKQVIEAANLLKHRDFLTVALVVPHHDGFDDNWIYIHEPNVRVGRIQNFGQWSPFMIKDGLTCLGLEYFVNKDDEIWNRKDDELINFATDELLTIGLLKKNSVKEGYVVRVPNAYPVYDENYSQCLEVVKKYLDEVHPNLYTVGRNGMHRYNNQDHSMLTAMLAVENLMQLSKHDLWKVNVDNEYHEERLNKPNSGTGRDAPNFTNK